MKKFAPKIALFVFALGCSSAFAWDTSLGQCGYSCYLMSKRCLANNPVSVCEPLYQDCIASCSENL